MFDLLFVQACYNHLLRWAPIVHSNIDLSCNRYINNETDEETKIKVHAVYSYLKSRMSLSIHQQLSTYSTENTLNYLYYHMRCGIFAMIRNNKLVVFCPFVNKAYRNKWNNCMKLDCHDNSNIDEYYSIKETTARRENYLSDMSEWWANGNIICNEHQKVGEKPEETQWWGDNFNFQLKDMISETCRLRDVSYYFPSVRLN